MSRSLGKEVLNKALGDATSYCSYGDRAFVTCLVLFQLLSIRRSKLASRWQSKKAG